MLTSKRIQYFVVYTIAGDLIGTTNQTAINFNPSKIGKTAEATALEILGLVMETHNAGCEKQIQRFDQIGIVNLTRIN